MYLLALTAHNIIYGSKIKTSAVIKFSQSWSKKFEYLVKVIGAFERKLCNSMK